MSWFSNKWNRWNQDASSRWSDVEWLEVVWNRQKYQVALPSTQEPLKLAHLRQELSSVFSLPVDRIVVVFQGIILKDDRVLLQEYGLATGSRITLVTQEQLAQRAPTPAPAPHTSAQPQPVPTQAPNGTAPPEVPTSEMPGQAAGVPAGEQAQGPPAPLAPKLTEDEKHIQRIQQVSEHCRKELLSRLEQFEACIQRLPNAPPGQLQAQSQQQPETMATDTTDVPPHKIPYTQRTLSELLLRQLLKLDDIPSEKDEIRSARKATVKEVQGYMDRVDAAWTIATKEKGIVSDV